MSRAGLLASGLSLAALLSACGPKAPERADAPQPPARSGIAVAPAAASPQDDGQWTMPAKDYANTRFSGLSEINKGNVKDLQVALTFSAGTMLGQESAPLVVGDTLYFVTPYPNILYAIDLTQPGGKLKWKFDPKPDASAQGMACCQPVNRGPTYADGTIFYNTIDTHTVAVDAATGKLKWKTRVGDFNAGETFTMAPLVVKGKVLVGNSGAEFGARGWLAALDAGDGAIRWRAYMTGPDKDVLIDPAEFKPFYPQYRGKDLGVSQWPKDHWKIGGGTVWGWLSYDPELNLVYHGTSNPAPWNHLERPGDNHWTNGIFARDPDTGKAKWFYQFSPHDLWDHSAINENIVLDIPWQGRTRKVVLRPERNGYMYLLDRTSGEVLAADPFVHITASKGVDLKTGRLIHNPEKVPQLGKTVRDVCPNSPGAKDWSPSAFSKVTGLVYVPHNNLCMDWETKPVNYIKGTPYIGVNPKFKAGPGGNAGEFMAWDPVGRRKVWTIPEKWPVWSGAVATAGGLVFYGNLEGWFKAVDANTGQVLWQFKTGSGIIGQPTTWRGPDGRQYVAILSGIGGWAGAIVSSDLDPRDPTAAKGFGNMSRDIKADSNSGGMLYVFALPKR
ncbi:PQQ-dependent dehydrogenase, methanol/ethanol family [Phenylobacterium sp. VNQ135]|uniref:PQQ-dependent dehydrogenase, methanol/ethanol family n=1 Tax=Phenylobacterium sp. VNQ135 TaxID=3400922 RepID=UPI003C0F0A71